MTCEPIPAHVSVKESVFPFVKFAGVDIVLGPEMRSTGEVMGVSERFSDRLCQKPTGRRRGAADQRQHFHQRRIDRSRRNTWSVWPGDWWRWVYNLLATVNTAANSTRPAFPSKR